MYIWYIWQLHLKCSICLTRCVTSLSFIQFKASFHFVCFQTCKAWKPRRYLSYVVPWASEKTVTRNGYTQVDRSRVPLLFTAWNGYRCCCSSCMLWDSWGLLLLKWLTCQEKWHLKKEKLGNDLLPPQKKNDNGTSTTWRCISYWKWGFSTCHLSFHGCIRLQVS